MKRELESIMKVKFAVPENITIAVSCYDRILKESVTKMFSYAF
jgi:hypothetical protein